MTEENTVYKLPSEFILKITGGPDRGTTIPLFCMNEYTIGRSDECTINIDDADSKASRRHALLKVGSDDLVLEDLESGNGTFLNGEKVQSSALKQGDIFQVGTTVFLVDRLSGGKKEVKEDTVLGTPAKASYKTAGIAAAVVICIILAAVLLMGNNNGGRPGLEERAAEDPPASEAGEMDQGAGDDFFSDQPVERARTEKPLSRDKRPPIGSIVTDSAKKQADLFFKQGILLYDNGELKKAIDKWYSALELDPTDSIVKKRLIKAEEELEREIDRRYQSALLHKKYMRYSEAEEEFRIVIELIRHKDDERYINSMKQIKELRER